MKLSKFILGFLMSLLIVSSGFSQEDKDIFTLSVEADFPNDKGLNGSFVGTHNDVLIVAGGANFPEKNVWEGGKKHFYNSIYVLERQEGKSVWHKSELTLPKAVANGASIITSEGIICIGGNNSTETFSDVFLLKWNKKERKIVIETLSPMPIPLAKMGASLVEDTIYLVGGQESNTGKTTKNFLSFNVIATIERTAYTWKTLDDFPGAHRMQAVVVGQSNGHQDCLYVMSGMSYDPTAEKTHIMLSDVYQYDPHKKDWTQKGKIPNNNTPGEKNGYIGAAPAIKTGDSHILIFGGAGGVNQHLNERLLIGKKLKVLHAKSQFSKEEITQIEDLEEKGSELIQTTSFTKTIYAYHTITDTWTPTSSFKGPAQVVTKAVNWNGKFVIPGGEISPGVRTSGVTSFTQNPFEASFGWVNYVTLISYLSIMILMGWYFSRKNKTTDDYFLGGGRIPWWAAGLSIYATMLSAITYLSQPALAFSFDWQAYLGYFTIILVIPIVVSFYLPFFRKLKITTAYEYLEKRFNITVRMFGSTSFVLFQLVRMGIVVYLPALALSTVVGIDIYLAIIVMGILAIVYTYLGGMEAVIWTDVIQVIVLIGGLIVGLVFIAIEIGDVGYIFKTAYADSKLTLVDFRFSFTEVVTWSLFLGSFALTLVPYTTDQAVVQRYMTTSTLEESKKSIWLNGLIAIPSGLLIFTMGTFLYVYFKEHPEFLTVGMQNDSVFPLFITNHLPPGVSGLVIAGIFSASMSSLDSSMHSISTVVTVDFYKRFNKTYTDAKGLFVAKWTTVIVGVFGTMIACLMAAYPVKSLFFLFQEVIGLFGSAIAGIFILGIFIKAANWKGAIIGSILSVIVLVFIKYYTPLNFYIYPLIAIPTCVIGGYIASLIFKVDQKNIDDLVYSKKKIIQNDIH